MGIFGGGVTCLLWVYSGISRLAKGEEKCFLKALVYLRGPYLIMDSILAFVSPGVKSANLGETIVRSELMADIQPLLLLYDA